MKTSKNYYENFIKGCFFLITGTLYVYALASSILQVTILEVSNIDLLYFSFFIILTLFLISYNRYWLYTFIILLTFFALFTYLNLKANKFDVLWYKELKAHLSETVLFVRGYLPFEERYTKTIVLIICAIISIYAWLNIKIFFNFYMITLLGLAVFGVSIVRGYGKSIDSYLVFLFCLLVFLSKKLNSFVFKKENRKVNFNFSFTMIVPCGLLVFSLSLLPMPKNTLDNTNIQTFFENNFEWLNNFFYEAFNPKYFSFQTTGFSNKNGKLGGPVIANNRYVMDVIADERTYLKGGVKSIYTGDSWINPKENETSDKENHIENISDRTFKLNEANETLLGLTKLSSEFYGDNLPKFSTEDLKNLEQIFSTKELTINIGNSRTGTIFKPNMPIILEFFDDIIISHKTNGDLFTEKLLNNDTNYRYEYISINYNAYEIVKCLKNRMKMG